VCGNVLEAVEGACPAAFRRGHTLVAGSEGGVLYVFGGQTLAQVVGGDTRPRNDLWAVDVLSGEWNELYLDWRETTANWTLDCTAYAAAAAAPVAPRSSHIMASVPGTREIVFAGGQCGSSVMDDLWTFQTQSRTWTRLATHTTQLARSSGVVWNNTLFLFGGINASTDECTNRLLAVPLKGPAAGVPVEITPAAADDSWPQPRAMHTATVFNGTMVVFGGTNSTTALNDLWTFDFASRRWTRVENSGSDAWPAGRFAHAAALCDAEASGVGNPILAVQGGMRSSSQVFSDLYTFDFVTQTWSFRTNEGRTRAFAGIACISSRVWVFGGTDMQYSVFNDLVSFLLT